MPANRTVASLSIALIVFVMLTFVLAVTTYLFFKQRLDEQAKAETATAETNKARTELNTALDEKRKLQEILGVAEEKTVAQIEAETNERFTGEFVGFDAEPKTYLKLVDWLAEAIRKKDGQMDTLRVDHEKVVADKDKAIESEKSAAARAAAEKEKVAADAAAEKQKFDDSRGQHEAQQQQLSGKRDEALNQAIAFDKLKAEVAKGGQFLYPEQQKDFEARKDPEGQLSVLYAALRARAQVIDKQNELLATLRAGDEAVQAAVMAATPQDNRIDGFDGRVIAVDSADRTALISCRSTRGMRPGLLLAVYDPADPRPQLGARKGLLEVIAVESPTVARARVRRDSIRNPILGGDGVATSLWAPGESPEVAIVGFVQLDGDPTPDADALQAAIARAGGRVVDAVTPGTALVVDAGVPKPVAGGGDGKIPGWRANVDEKRRDREIKSARQLGIRVVGLDEMLDLLGLERADLETGRLPTRGDDGRSLPRRAAGVAY
jgi:hypothetical protein